MASEAMDRDPPCLTHRRTEQHVPWTIQLNLTGHPILARRGCRVRSSYGCTILELVLAAVVNFKPFCVGA